MPTQRLVAAAPKSSIFVVMTVRNGSEAAVRDFLTELSGLTRSVGFREPEGELQAVVGIGASFWDRTFTAARPLQLHPFKEFHGVKHSAPRTPGDIFLHLRAIRADLPFELLRLIMNSLDGHVDIVDEVHAFRYFDQRNLLGFVDGTENPEGDDIYRTVLIGDEDPEFAGGSYVLTQKYLHDMSKWNDESVEEQQRIVGRTKLDDVELDEQSMPSNSHVELTDIEDEDGNDLNILRYNMPFGDFQSNTLGTYFVGYAADPTTLEHMLENMFIGDPVGNYDRLLDFSTAQTGGLFFVPSIDQLDSIDELAAAHVSADIPETTPDAEIPADEPVAPDEQPSGLGIGSLRRQHVTS